MKSLRILLLSAVRPSRTWRIAQRISRETECADICIVQQSTEGLSSLERCIATHGPDCDCHCQRERKEWFRSAALKGIDFVLWWLHGCPRGLPQEESLTTIDLKEKCHLAQWPMLEVNNPNGVSSLHFTRDQHPDLGIKLGDVELAAELQRLPVRGWIQARQEKSSTNVHGITIEHLDRNTGTASQIARLVIPFQPYDGRAGFAIKTDLLIDDLFVETANCLQMKSVPETASTVAEWTQQMYSPLLTQLKPSNDSTLKVSLNQRIRSYWKLCLDTLLLCSPLCLARNWYRRLRHQYPVVILAHHLISDREHRMAMSTESFWRQVRFLKKHYRIVSLADGVRLLRSGKISVPTVVLTFDDGYADNFLNLRAIAEETSVPVAHFVAVEPVEVQRAFDHDTDEASRRVLPLSWRQIAYWSSRGAEFGSHTRTHLDCGINDPTVLEPELIGSKNDLEAKLHTPVEFFAFPFGQQANMSAEAIKLASSSYSCFVSSFGGENLPQHFRNRKHLLRKIFYADPWELELELQSIFDWANALKGAFRAWRPSSSTPSTILTFPNQLPSTTKRIPL